MRPPALLMRLPSHVLNGMSVATGIALIDLALLAGPGRAAALAASTGAICASLADQPIAPARTWRRVAMAGFVGWASGLLVAALREFGVTMGLTTMGLAFCAAMALAWGLRAAPLAFVPLLALVFTLAAPPPADPSQLLLHAAWSAAGVVAYFGWAVATSRALQPRYRTLALAGALEALAGLLRSRAALLAAAPEPAPDEALAAPLTDWIRSQVTLDERLQAARDLLFPAARSIGTRPAVATLVQAVEMRDALLAGELDVELLGGDAAARRLRAALRDRGLQIAVALEDMARGLRERGLARAGAGLRRLPPWDFEAGPGADAPDAARVRPDDPRYPLAVALAGRAHQTAEVCERLQAALGGEATPLPLAPAELEAFISPEGWPLAPLVAQFSLQSPILRHAVRLSLALGTAYFLGLGLPWASHPYWLVLSVAVVMRGNLEQTLSRRDDRVLGTMVGCLLVLGLGRFAAPWVATAVFLVAVGIAHSFATRRFVVTSGAASVMALMQAHLAQPAGGFGALERLGDTLLGAALAWGFSYFWPWWERRGVARLAERVLGSLRSLSTEVLCLPDPARPDLRLRLARREVYESVGAIAATAQRTGAEPESVRVPLYLLAEMLTRCHVLMAQLLTVRLLLIRRRAQLEPAATRQALAASREVVVHALEARARDAQARAAVTGRPTAAGPVPAEDIDHAPVPATLPDEALLPWLERRLRLAERAAQRVGLAAQALRAAGD